MVKVGKYDYLKSNKQNKKLMVNINDKWVHFGDTRYQHYKDRSGIWSKMDHKDDERRKKYLARATKIKNKNGDLTANDPSSPNYHAIRILW